MGMDEVNRIKGIFADLGFDATYLEHEAVITSEDAAKTRGFELRQGIKAIVCTDDMGHWAVVDVPAHLRVDLKAAAELLGWPKGKIRMGTPEEVLEVTGCERGAVPPFGHKQTLPLCVDVGVYDNTISTFNIGLRTHSVKVETAWMKTVFEKMGAKEGRFAKSA